MFKNLNKLADRQSILTRIQNIKPDTPRLWGTMSPQAMFCHCSDQFRLAYGEKSAKRIDKFVYRTFAKWAFLYLINFPKNFRTLPELKADAKGTPISPAFEADRQSLIAYIERFTEVKDLSPHPAFGPLTAREWGRVAYLHLDHHLRQFGN